MRAQFAWFHRLPEILNVLCRVDSSHLDLQAVEQLFGVRERRARQLMAGLPGIRAGKAAAIARHAIVERMEATARSGVYQWEVRRRTCLAKELDRTRREIAARRHLTYPRRQRARRNVRIKRRLVRAAGQSRLIRPATTGAGCRL